MRIAKEFTFDSAHFLKDYHGKCERMHGHTYKIDKNLLLTVWSIDA
jgi:6-pyruvoyltetrahydropterin/6-carboxytetrahydropterin synthase